MEGGRLIFGEFLARVQRQISRTDIGNDEYVDYCQRALKKIQQRRSWTCMKQSSPELTMAAGTTFLNLPNNFKELQAGDAPIRVVRMQPDAPTRPIPCWVLTKRECEREYSKFAYGIYSAYYRYQLFRIPVFLDQSGDVWTVNIIYQACEDMNFLVDYYGFLPNPIAPDDTNFFLSNYEEMCMAKAKEICWQGVNDEIAEEAAAIFNREFKECAADDQRRQTRGVQMRM